MTNLRTDLTAGQTRAGLASVRDRLDRSNRKDTFFFTLSGRGSFNANLRGIQRNANVDLFLLNGSGQRISQSTRKGNRSETIRVGSLEAGTYTIEAVLRGRKSTRYTLSATALLNPGTPPPVTDSAGNSLTAARVVDVGATPSSFADRVSPSDEDDYYRFTVGDAANPSAKLNLLLTKTPGSGAGDITLRDSLGNVVKTTFVGSSDGSGALTETLAAGTYYVQINSASTDPFVYNLSLAAAPILDTAGNTPGTARALSLSPAPTVTTEFVGTGDTKDFYSFSVGAPGSPSGIFTATMTGVGGNLLGGSATVRLRDNLGNVVQSEPASGGGGTLFNRILAAGTYFLEVETSSPSVDYSLNLTSTPIADSAGNTLATARPITVSSSPTTVSDFVGPGDFDDYYRLTIPSGSLNLAITGVGGNLLSTGITVRLLDSLGSQIQQASASSGGTTLTRSLTAGTYFVRLETFSTSVGSSYNFTFSLLP